MRKFFDSHSRRELVNSGPGSGGGGGSSGSGHGGGNFIGRSFTIGRHQVTVEEIIAEGEKDELLSSRIHTTQTAAGLMSLVVLVHLCFLAIGQ